MTPLPSTVTELAPLLFAALIARAMSACVMLAGRRGIKLLPGYATLNYHQHKRPRKRANERANMSASRIRRRWRANRTGLESSLAALPPEIVTD